MNSVIESAILFAVRQLLTPQLVRDLEVQFIKQLRELAANSETKIDDAVVDIVAEALGVQA